MKIYTKAGDKGTTALVWGTKVSKADVRIEACGAIDELNAWIGVLASYSINEPYKELLKEIQDRLFTIGATIMTEEHPKNPQKIPALLYSDIEILEKNIDVMSETLEPMRQFILPGGHKEVAFAHVARTVCRRAERQVVRLAQQCTVHELIIPYLNRLSDFLFTFCRVMSKNLSVEEIKWNPRV